MRNTQFNIKSQRNTQEHKKKLNICKHGVMVSVIFQLASYFPNLPAILELTMKRGFLKCRYYPSKGLLRECRSDSESVYVFVNITDFQINNFTAFSRHPSALTLCEINYLEICMCLSDKQY